ncbi:hypothetical protein B5K11_32165 [Rhizobium leguminosarum bv. trifolii]|uniref:hypothetical protein n=1 Tax=Rhizobium leguminosarum TaxID=384 RepID=UPI000E2E45B2|nr:hypothetical protein [Rhizobium leguminosarum]RFB84796.1 hypothetical protein B5K11_32165 [Rhizobium leguminosarum bv. trifolii]
MTGTHSLDDALILRIETIDGTPAFQLGEILRTLSIAFRQFSNKRHGAAGEATLHVIDLRHGSLEIILDAIDGAQKLMKAAELLAPFASHLMEVATIVIGQKQGKVANADRKAIEAIANPVANGSATQINLIVHGDAHFTFDKTSAFALQGANTLAVAAAPKQVIAHGFGAHPIPHYVTEQQSRLLTSDGLFGTAISVDGEWFARLEGGHGVLVPLTAAPDILATLRHRTAYRFKGAVRRGPVGEQIGIDVQEIAAISH